MKKTGWKQITAWLLLTALLIVSGCGKGGGENAPSASGSPDGTGSENEKEQSMGRYIEQQIELPEEFELEDEWKQTELRLLDGGELALAAEGLGLYVSADKGETWEKRPSGWLPELSEQAYIAQLSIAPDGSMAVVYSPKIEEGGESDYNPQGIYADPEGTKKELEDLGSGELLQGLYFGKDSRLYGFSISGNVYEVQKEDGTFRQICRIDGVVDYVTFTDKYMVILTSQGADLYDLEAETLAQKDEVLQDFIIKQTNGAIGSNTGSHMVVMAAGEEQDAVYLVMEQGFYRHVLNGTVMEQAADGALNSMGDPQMHLSGMEVLSAEEFFVLYNGPQLCHYTYDPNVPAVPEEQMSVYSLEEDYTIRQAVSLYQKKNPGTYIRYEVGMTGDDGVTKEDAVKNLNTKIMSGNGPDLIVLDGLPEDSYKEKGILGDLTELEKELTGENSLFPNLVEAFRKDGKLYSMPVRFRLPLIVGNTEQLKGITSLESLADAVEKLREEHPEGALTRMITEEQTLFTLGLASSGAWIGADGNLDEAKLTEFLTQAKRVYEVETAGWDAAELKELQNRVINLWSELEGLTVENFSASASSAALDIATGDRVLGIGTVTGMNGDFNMISTLADQEETIDYAACPGQMPDSFIPDTCVGIYANSMENELALDFWRFLFGAELQDLELPGGFPVNMASFEKLKINPNDDEDNGGISIGGSGPDGEEYFSLDIKWVTETQFQRLKEMVETVQTVSRSDSVIEDTVLEIGSKALKGDVSVEDAVKEIVKKAAIYLAE